MFQHLAPTVSDPTMCYADPVNPVTPERSGRCYRTATDTAFIVLETTHIKFDNFYMLGHVACCTDVIIRITTASTDIIISITTASKDIIISITTASTDIIISTKRHFWITPVATVSSTSRC